MDKQRKRLSVSAVNGGGGDEESRPLAPDLGELCAWLMESSADGERRVTPAQQEVFCVHSETDHEARLKQTFGEKDRFGEQNVTALNAAEVFFTCRKGKKPEAPNQDSFVTVTSKGNWSLFGVFDGHGPHGHDVSDYALKVLVNEFLRGDFLNDTEGAFNRAFKSSQESLHQIHHDRTKPFSPESSGSTCTMVFHNIARDDLVFAHAGDSRGVLFHGVRPLYKTEDHKPELPKERERIEAAGGRVIFDGYYNYRVFARNRNYPGLNMSRALGDCRAHDEAGLSAVPELQRIGLKELRLKDSDLTLLICSDGVWEFLNEGNVVTYFEKSNSRLKLGQNSVDRLATESFDQWMKDSDNEISDDITVLVANLSVGGA